VGGDAFNVKLSEQRADSVKDFLGEQGVSLSSITAQGFGKAEPVATNDTAEGRQRNRRVEIVVNGDAIGTSATATARPATKTRRRTAQQTFLVKRNRIRKNSAFLASSGPETRASGFRRRPEIPGQ
jgi:hypothetical protein